MSTTNPHRPQILPEPTLRRLPWYLALLTELRSEGIEHVSSTRIAQELSVDASQIAKDLSFLNIKGKTRIGYDVEQLRLALRDFLGFDRVHNAVMVGVGSLGAALIRDTGLQRYGLNIVAGFDTNPALIGSDINGIPILHPDRLDEFVHLHSVVVGVVAVPFESAPQVADSLVSAGVKAIWNFTPRRLCVPDNVAISNTSIYSHLAVMYNRMNQK